MITIKLVSYTILTQRGNMPTVKRIRSYRFYFWSREEPRRHIHIDSADGTAKFWLEPDVELADFYNMKRITPARKVS